MYNSLCMFTVLWVNDIENKTHLYTHVHTWTHMHIQKYILNKSPVLVGGGLGREGGHMFQSWWIKKKKKEKKTLCIFKADVVVLKLKLYFIVQEEI